jgi:acetyl-CoA synthetase
MPWQTIEKPQHWPQAPNLLNYEEVRNTFSWAQARRALDGLPSGRGLNIAYEAVDRHAVGTPSNHLALRWLGRRGESRDFTYADLCRQTNRFANLLKRLGVATGERVFLLARRIPELYISALGALKGGYVFCPLFSAFGPEPIRQRIRLGDGRVLVTTAALFKRKVAEIRSSLPGLQHILLIGDPSEIKAIPGTCDFAELMADADDRFEVAPTQPEDRLTSFHQRHHRHSEGGDTCP